MTLHIAKRFARVFAPRRSRRRPPTVQLKAERLETRRLLDSYGLLEGDSAHLTLSFAPDGTDISGHSSALFETMNQLAGESQWQQAVTTAFQTWAGHTNADVGVVSDQGQPFGAAGPTTGDSRFGDVRIGTVPLSPEVMAISVPSNALVTGSWVGDIILNSDADFESIDQLFSVALHEAGHVFGLEHSQDPSSPMHIHGPSPAVQLTDADMANLQAFYGARSPDLNELNDDFDDATRLQMVTVPGKVEGSGPAIAHGDISSFDDQDVFLLETPSDYMGPVTIRVRVEGLSTLNAKLSVYDEEHNLLAEAQSHGVTTDLVITVNQGVDDREFLFVVAGDTNDIQSLGGYAVIATFDNLLQIDQQEINLATDGRYRFVSPSKIRSFFQDGEDPLRDDDEHVDDDFAFAKELESSIGFSKNSRYETYGSLTDSIDVDFYSFETPEENPGTMVVSLTSVEPGGLIPMAEVFDETMAVVPAEILADGDGQYTIQIEDFELDSDYLLRIRASETDGEHATGNYRASVSFSSVTLSIDEMASGNLTPEAPVTEHLLHVADPQIFHFLLGVQELPDSQRQAVEMTIVNSTGQRVVELVALPGKSRSTNGVLLEPGTYSIRAQLLRLGDPAAVPSSIGYRLSGAVVSDPFGVRPINPVGEPVFRCELIDNRFCYPNDVVSENPFFVDPEPVQPPDAIISSGKSRDTVVSDWWSWLRQKSAENRAPQSNADAFLTPVNQPLIVGSQLGLLNNDSDADGDSLQSILVSGPQHGTLDLSADGSFVYMPSTNFVGSDSFQYAASDDSVFSEPVAVMITVEPSFSPGDANKDGIFDSSDLLLVFQAGQYDDGVTGNSAWLTGDWNGDGEFDSGDLILAFQQNGYVA